MGLDPIFRDQGRDPELISGDDIRCGQWSPRGRGTGTGDKHQVHGNVSLKLPKAHRAEIWAPIGQSTANLVICENTYMARSRLDRFEVAGVGPAGRPGAFDRSSFPIFLSRRSDSIRID